MQFGALTYQAIKLRGTVLETARLAKATEDLFKLSNKEFIATHRPRLRVHLIRRYWPIANERPYAHVTAVDVGDTDATIVAIGGDIFLRHPDGSPDRQWTAEPQPLPDVMTAPPGLQLESDIRAGNPLTIGQAGGC